MPVTKKNNNNKGVEQATESPKNGTVRITGGSLCSRPRTDGVARKRARSHQIGNIVLFAHKISISRIGNIVQFVKDRSTSDLIRFGEHAYVAVRPMEYHHIKGTQRRRLAGQRTNQPRNIYLCVFFILFWKRFHVHPF